MKQVSFNEVITAASALSKNNKAGGMKADLYFRKGKAFMTSSSGTVILKFSGISPDPGLVKFSILDYEGDEIKMFKDSVTFVTKGKYHKSKNVPAPKLEYMKIYKATKVLFKSKPFFEVNISDEVLHQVEEGLSHIEFSCVEGAFKITQRDIYSGAIINIEKPVTSGFNFEGDLKDFKPVSMRTSDFIGMFLVTDSMLFGFCDNITKVSSSRFRGIISNCKYDEMLNISTL